MIKISDRVKDKRLDKLFKEGKKVYSISKLNTIADCEYSAWRTYVKKDRGLNGIYSVLGSTVHDTLELIMNDMADETSLKSALYKDLAALDMLGLDFPNEKIRENWLKDMNHFCENYNKPKGKFTTEELIILKLNENTYMQGYVDLVKHNADDTISIYDYKTSTDFDDESLIKSGRQLITYAMAKEQEGFKVNEVAWIMLKYCEVSFRGKSRRNSKEETDISKVINRGKLATTLKPYIEYNLRDLGYDDIEIEIMLKEVLDTNSLKSLPIEIIEKYNIKPYVRKYAITEDIKTETMEYIKEMIRRFESKSNNESDWGVKDFYKITKYGKPVEDTFFCTVLCNHRKSCPHIKKFFDMKNMAAKSDEDLF